VPVTINSLVFGCVDDFKGFEAEVDFVVYVPVCALDFDFVFLEGKSEHDVIVFVDDDVGVSIRKDLIRWMGNQCPSIL
jgi:hypothetical protein